MSSKEEKIFIISEAEKNASTIIQMLKNEGYQVGKNILITDQGGKCKLEQP